MRGVDFGRGLGPVVWLHAVIALACHSPTVAQSAQSGGDPFGPGQTRADLGGDPPAGSRRVGDPPPPGRLGDRVVPTAYALDITADPDNPVISGEIAIDLRVSAPVNTIWLHSEGPVITAAHLVQSAAEIAVVLPPRRPEPGLIGFDLERPLPSGTATLSLSFRAALGEQVGAFRQRSGGDYYIFTDFEPIDARRAFPNFDEPRFKTPWSIALTVPRGQRALSNMPVIDSAPVNGDGDGDGDGAGGRTRVRFATTRPLPS